MEVYCGILEHMVVCWVYMKIHDDTGIYGIYEALQRYIRKGEGPKTSKLHPGSAAPRTTRRGACSSSDLYPHIYLHMYIIAHVYVCRTACHTQTLPNVSCIFFAFLDADR